MQGSTAYEQFLISSPRSQLSFPMTDAPHTPWSSRTLQDGHLQFQQDVHALPSPQIATARGRALTEQVLCLRWLDLAELAVPEAGDLDILGGLGAQVCVRGLDGLKYSSNLSG